MKKSLSITVALAIALFGALPASAQEAPDELSIDFNEETGELTFGYGKDLDCQAPETVVDGAEAPAQEDLTFGFGEDDDASADDDDVSKDDDADSEDDDAVSSDDDDVSKDDDDVSKDDDDVSKDDDDVSKEDTDKTEGVELLIGVCNTIDATGPNGQINHGSAVSSFVHALKNSDYGGKIGELVRQVAKSEFGKGEKEADGDSTKDGEKGNKNKEKKDKEGKGKPANPGSNGKGKNK